MPRLSVANSSKPSTNSPMIRNTRQGSVCLNSSGRGLSSSCSSCVVPGGCRLCGVFVFSILIRGYLLSVRVYPRSLNTHDVIAAVHVDHFAGNTRRHRTHEKYCGIPDLAWIDITTERRSFCVMFQH